MKGIKLTSLLAIGLTFFMSIFSTTSCTRECPCSYGDTITLVKKDTVTITKKDTLLIEDKDTLLTESMLTANPWIVTYLRAIYGDQPMFYQRGGSNNTANFDREKTTFYADHTGYVIDGNGFGHAILSWTLTPHGDYVTLQYQYVNQASPNQVVSTITWDKLRYKNGSLFYNEYYYDQLTGQYSHGELIRIPGK